MLILLKNLSKRILPLAALFFLAQGCTKFLEPEYRTQVGLKDVFANDANLEIALTGLYTNLIHENSGFSGAITRMSGFSASELRYAFNDGIIEQFINHDVQPNNSQILQYWNAIYKDIYNSNSIIEGCEASTGLTPGFKKQAIGEAKFIRAFSHFYLINLFGDVPLITVTNKDVTGLMPRTPVAEVYQQIVADLKDAYNILAPDYSFVGGKRIRVNKWAAAALLARVYLFMKDYVNAESLASDVIANNALYQLDTNLDNVFKKNNGESILQMERAFNNTGEGDSFLFYFKVLGFADNIMTDDLVGSFESNDERTSKWMAFALFGYIPYKYKSPDTNEENYVFLRLAEQYLIRAEARVQQNKFSEAQTDINTLRTRSGLAEINNMIDKSSSMIAIENEKRHEFFCEWGHRWFDLKRWPSLRSNGKSRADDILGAINPEWESTDQLYPIPEDAIFKNPNLTQNPGY